MPLAIGSDSHVTPRLARGAAPGSSTASASRCASATSPPRREHGKPSTAARLFERVLAGGGAAAGERRWGLVRGARADLLVVDCTSDALLGMPADALLDALVFSSPGRPWRDVMVAGRWVLDAPSDRSS